MYTISPLFLHIFFQIVSTVLLILARVRRRTYAGGSGSGSGSGGVLSWYVSTGSLVMRVDNSTFWDTHGRESCVVTGLTAEVKDFMFVLH